MVAIYASTYPGVIAYIPQFCGKTVRLQVADCVTVAALADIGTLSSFGGGAALRLGRDAKVIERFVLWLSPPAMVFLPIPFFV
jgi:hypothetical protein